MMLNIKTLPTRFQERTAYFIFTGILKIKKAYLLISHRISIVRGRKGQRQSAFNFKVCIITKVCEEEWDGKSVNPDPEA